MKTLYTAIATAEGGREGTTTSLDGSLTHNLTAPKELGGSGEGTNPEELFAAAHANCFTSTLTSLARRRELPLDRVSTEVTTELVWSDGHGDHRLASSTIDVRIASSAPWAEVEQLVREAERECPVCRAIAGNVEMRVDLARV
jgi:Ohr subfamily peroxiredoxin